MAIRLEVSADTQPGDTILICGAEPTLGEWDLARAVRLSRAGEEASGSPWTGEIPIPVGGMAFKFLLLRGTEFQWEPLDDNRRWPTTGLGDNTLVRTTFGEAKMAIEASATQIESNARQTRKMIDRRGSELEHNLEKKGEFAYYHAHNRDFQVPEDAKVISGPGLITGGAPVLLEAGASPLDGAEEERTVWLQDYSWSDSTAKVKVYVEVAEGILPVEGANGIVETEYLAHKVNLTINSKPRYKLSIEKLNAEIKVESCCTRVEAHKNRIVLQLAKKRETSWYNLTKKNEAQAIFWPSAMPMQ
eukprot:CAMPEP_0117464354 /NCGR_PEP_ID=MMETSP0784-20121206/4057_1 /TAXON_ID=39447 /ORGANISM="" /LENGTH=302 /DNA_ID=CAMNT_0005258209 /DNA_START=26 /DNA_END=932 /DNA_ORIENTATION=+